MDTALLVFYSHTFFVNIAMVIGIFPTIGVPLPFLLWIWIMGFYYPVVYILKMDANKVNEW
jgi:rod shape determining protein RodA